MLIPALVDAIATHQHLPGFCGADRARGIDLGLPQDMAAREREKAVLSGAWPAEPQLLGAESVHLVHASAMQGTEVNGSIWPDWTNQRVALLAHWSADGLVAPYVRNYLEALKTLGYQTVLIGGRPLIEDDALRDLCVAILFRTVAGYDFTSWKAAFAAMPSLWQASEVLCTNDSVFGPVGSLSAVHAAMDNVPCDVWGLVESHEKRPHVQSYYLVLRAKALRHPALSVFMDAVDQSPDKFATVLRYEVALAPWLALHGLRIGVWVPAASLPRGNFNPAHYLWRVLLERFELPFIKRDLLRNCAEHPHLSGWEDCLARRGYDPDLVHDALLFRNTNA